MSNILIMVAAYGKSSDTPCGKDMHALVQALLGYGDANITVLMPQTEVPLKDITGEHLEVCSIETLASRRKRLAGEYNKQVLFQKIKLRLELHQINHKIAKTYFMGDLISFSDLKDWIKQHKTRRYDLLISVSYPFYIQEYAHEIRKKLRIKKWIPYLLDPYADNFHCYKDTKHKRIKKEKKLFKKCTDIFTVEEIVSQAYHSPIKHFSDKIQYIPTHLIGDNTHYHANNETEFVHFVYTGLFYPDIRNPEKLLQYFMQLPDNYILNLYSKGCMDVVKKYKEVLGDRLQVNDYILDQEEYNKMIGRADFLVDVGNTVSNQVPSKILTYCSFGKPIIHFKNCEDEVIGDKFAKYSLFSVIDYAEDIERVTKAIKTVVKMNFGKRISYQEIKNNFSDCTVEYVVEKIKNILGEL